MLKFLQLAKIADAENVKKILSGLFAEAKVLKKTDYNLAKELKEKI